MAVAETRDRSKKRRRASRRGAGGGVAGWGRARFIDFDKKTDHGLLDNLMQLRPLVFPVLDCRRRRHGAERIRAALSEPSD
jgi:hypothetical protein